MEDGGLLAALKALLLAVTPPELTHTVSAVLLAASFVCSFITAAFGIGGGALLLAIMATLTPPAMLIPAHGVIQLGSNAGRTALLFRHISWPALGGFTLGSLIGVGLGGALVINIPPAFVQIGVGLFIIWTVLARPPAWLKRWPTLTGALSSFLTMFFGATGLFVAAYTKSLTLDRFGHVATHGALMTVQHGLKTVMFGLLGVALGPWMAFIAAMLIAGFIGTFVGRLVLVRLSEGGFRRILDLVLLLISARLIWSGVSASL